MGMGHAGCHVTAIDESVIKKYCPKLLTEFNEMKKVVGEITLTRIIEFQEPDEFDDDEKYTTDSILDIHDRLVKQFKEKTNLSISYFYHNSEDEGDRYDEIGEAWIVDNAYELTEAAKPFAKHIANKNFVSFG